MATKLKLPRAIEVFRDPSVLRPEEYYAVDVPDYGEPTDAQPGSLEKLVAMCARADRDEPVLHEDDRKGPPKWSRYAIHH